MRVIFVAGARWRVSPVAPRIVNDVSYVTRINHAAIFRGRRNIW